MTTHRDVPAPPADTSSQPGAHQAFLLLRTVFTVAPVLFGLDKFVGLLTNWEQYLAPQLDALIPGTAQQAMLAVGVVEILAGLLVAALAAYRRICGRRLAGRDHPQPAAHRRLLRHRAAGLRAARGRVGPRPARHGVPPQRSLGVGTQRSLADVMTLPAPLLWRQRCAVSPSDGATGRGGTRRRAQ